MIEQRIKSALTTASVTVYPVQAAQGAGLPYAVYIRDSSRPIPSLADGNGRTLDAGLFRVECFGVSYTAAKNIAATVRAAIETEFGSKAVRVHEADEKDKDGYFVQLNYSIWEQT